MQMLTTSSVHLRPAPPKITKTPFSLVTPKSLSTHALGKNISVRETVQLETQKEEKRKHGDLVLHSIAPYSFVLASKLLPGADVVESIFGPFVDLVKTWSLPEWLVHWGHPGNMAVVLFAMGGYGTYLGFRIRLSKDPEEKAKAKDLHPKLLAGMFFFFALGATGGITALLTSDKPIFESPHAVSGAIGLGLLTIQSILPALFKDYPGLRVAHGLLGSSIMTIFLIHAAFGLQLGLSF
ncbi:translation initiation factor [Carex rostrata]